MKKSTLIVIALVYVASIVIVSMFGMKAVVYNVNIPVLEIQCVNETRGDVYVDDSKSVKEIRITYDPDHPGELASASGEVLKGTILQLEFRVLPDNATDKSYRFVYAREQYPQVTFHKIGDRETGAIIFTAPALLRLTVIANDNSGVSTELLISCKRD